MTNSRLKIVLVGVSDPFFLKFGKRIAARGVSVDTIVASSKMYDLANETFQGARVYRDTDFLNPEFVKRLKCDKYALSESLIYECSKLENLFTDISDRFCYYPLSAKDRKTIYFRNLLFWFSFFRENSVNYVFFNNSPHFGYDNVMYTMARKFGVKTLYVERTFIRNRVLLKSDYERFYRIPESYRRGDTIDKIYESIDQSILEDISVESSWSEASKGINKDVLADLRGCGKLSVANCAMRLLTRAKKSMNVLLLFDRIFRKKCPSAFYMNGIGFNGLEIFLRNRIDYRNVRKMFRFYRNRISQVDYSRRYVFFAMHYQPERTTLPLGGAFHEQYNAINVLSKSVPCDWIIYVKEHPRQFTQRRLILKHRHFRNISDYSRILELDNVRLISAFEDANRLIRHAQFCATISGSVGWESLLQNKPCVVFGNPWYSPCESCFVVKSVSECKKSMKLIEDRSAEDVKMDLLRFISFYQDDLVVSSNSHDYAVASDLNYDDLVENLADKVLQLVEEG